MINVLYIMVFVFLVWLPANTIYADEILEASITVEGFVLNGTDEGAVLVNHTVVLHQDISGIHEDLETLSDDSGWFSFDEIIFNPQASYAISVEYQGVLYGQDLDLSKGSKSVISLVVYDSYDSADILSVSNVSVLFSDIDKVSQIVWTLEIVSINNNSNQTYVPGAGPMSLLRFGLPDSAQGLQVDTDFFAADVIQVDQGFGIVANVPPGEYEIMFAYFFPYTSEQIVFSKSLRYGAENIRILAPDGGIRISSEHLEASSLILIGDRPYQLLEGNNFPRGYTISLDISGLPRASFTDRVRRGTDNFQLEYVLLVILAALMMFLIGFSFWIRRTRQVGNKYEESKGQFEDKESDILMHDIVQVEEKFKAGLISGKEYRITKKRIAFRMKGLSDQ